MMPIAVAQDSTTMTNPTLHIPLSGQMSIFIPDENGKLAISISSKGKVEFGKDITPDAGAKAFADALEKYVGMKWCSK
jgi:hypothetical protein